MRALIMFAAAVLVLVPAGSLQAQNIARVRSHLAQPAYDSSGHSSRVEVREAGHAAEVVRRADAAEKKGTVNGFRVVVFFDNGPAARSDAERVAAAFSASYPDVRCVMRYENPYFKVLAGCCTTTEDATVLLGRIRREYPEAYIMRDDIRVRDLVTPKPAPAAHVPDDDSAYGFMQ